MTERIPYAIESPIVTRSRAVVALVEADNEWYNLPVNKAVGIMMQAVGGNLNPADAKLVFTAMVSGTGLTPIED